MRPTWFVDSAFGSDSNSGTTPGSALRTIAAATARIQAGQALALACGSHWREQLNIPADGIQVAAYGSGPKPLLDCSDLIDPAAWTKTAGFTNIYQAPLPVLQMGQQTFPGFWEDDVWLSYKTSIGAVDSTPGSYYPAGIGSNPPSPMMFYIRTSDGSDPRTNGKRYEYSRREAGLKSQFSTTVRGIHTRRNCGTPGSLVAGRYSHLEDCLASDGTFHSVYAHGGCYLKNVECRNAYHFDSLSMFVFFDDLAEGGDIVFEDCWAHIDSMPGTVAQSPGGYYGHCGSGQYGTITYRRCRTSGLNTGFAVSGAAHCVLDECDVAGAQWPYAVNCADSQVLGCSATGGSMSRVLATGGGPGLSIIVRNFSLVSPPNPGFMGFFAMDPDISLDIADSTFGPIGWSAAASRPKLKCFRVGFEGTSYYYIDLPSADAEPVESDYNHFDANGNGRFRWRGTEYSYASWRASIGQDTHSTP